jgi:hypothetical protein
MHSRHVIRIVLSAAIVSLSTSSAGQESRTAVATTPHFALHSDFAFNLHDALLAAGAARRAKQPEHFQAEPHKACFDGLPAAERSAWDRAVDYYAEIIAPGDAFARNQMLPRLALLWRTSDFWSGDERRFLEIARAFREAAAPAYERCRWQAQDAVNRRWIETLVETLERHEDMIARRLNALYATSWEGLPIPVDVVETVSWAGGDSIATNPPPGHVLVSSANADYQDPAAALELVFHEASHFLTGRDTPLRNALAAAGPATDPTQNLVWHAVLFYMTGETVRRVLAEAREPDYTPLIFALDIFGNVRPPIADVWPTYMSGDRSMPDAARELARRLDTAPR